MKYILAGAGITLALTAAAFAGQPLYPSFNASRAGTYTVFSVSAKKDAITKPTAINSNGDIAGVYTDGGEFRLSFLRTANGKITKFDPPGTLDSEFTSMNSAGTIVGAYVDTSDVGRGYIRATSGKITVFDVPKSAETESALINDKGVIAGTSITSQNVLVGYIRNAKGKFTKVTVAAAGTHAGEGTAPNFINNEGAVAGDFISGAHTPSDAFVQTADGTVATYNPPKSKGATAVYIDDSGNAVGYFLQKDETTASFIRAPGGQVTIFTVPSTQSRQVVSTYALGINKSGDVVGYCQDQNAVSYGFVRNSAGKFTILMAPGAGTAFGQGTQALAINDSGAVTGQFWQGSGRKGFLWSK